MPSLRSVSIRTLLLQYVKDVIHFRIEGLETSIESCSHKYLKRSTAIDHQSPLDECEFRPCGHTECSKKGNHGTCESSSPTNDVFFAPPRYETTSPDFVCVLRLTSPIFKFYIFLANHTATNMDPPTPFGSLGKFPREIRDAIYSFVSGLSMNEELGDSLLTHCERSSEPPTRVLMIAAILT